MIKSNFLNILKKYENKYNSSLSRREFSRISGIKRSITNRLFNNQVNGLKFDTLNKLVKFFHLPPSAFFTYSNQRMIFTLTNASLRTINSLKSVIFPSSHYDLEKLSNSIDNVNAIRISSTPRYSGNKNLDKIDFILIPFKPTLNDISSPLSVIPKARKYINYLERYNHPIYINFYYQIVVGDNPFATFYVYKNQFNQHFKYILNHLPLRLQYYIYDRLILHSRTIKRHHSGINEFTVNGSTSQPSRLIRRLHYSLNFSDKTFDTDVDGLLHLWKRQPIIRDKNGKRYRLITSNQGQHISIHDYTTNVFKS